MFTSPFATYAQTLLHPTSNSSIAPTDNSSTQVLPAGADELKPRAYLPVVMTVATTTSAGCPITSTASYDLISFQGGAYKGNRLTDENADMRLSVLGYSTTPTATNASLTLVDYNGSADGNAPRVHGLFEPNRVPKFLKNYQRHDWNWNENAPPPYGSQDGVNQQYPVTVIDMAATKGEGVYIPERNANNSGLGTQAMVLYADEDEMTLTYTDMDRPDVGYVVYIANFCVDPQLVAAYRAQLRDGKRATGKLPAVRNNERIGITNNDAITVAIRDSGPFLDPRSRKDWWQGISTNGMNVVASDQTLDTGR